MDKNTPLKQNQNNETPSGGGIPLGRLFLAVGVCLGLLVTLIVMKFVFHLF